MSSDKALDDCRSQHLRGLHRHVASVLDDTRDSGQIYESVLELARLLCAEVENFCVSLLKLPEGTSAPPTDLPVPVGSGVLVFSRHAPCDGWGILTAAHVVDEFMSRGGLDRIWIGSTMMVRSGDGRRPVALKRMKERFVVRYRPNLDDETLAPDIAWIGLTEADVRSIEAHGGVFFNLDSPRSRIPVEPDQGELPPGALPRCAVSVIVGMLGYNYRTGTGPSPVGGDVQLNLCMSMCGEPVFAGTSPEELHAFDFQVIQPTDEYGTLGDPVAGRIAPDSWKGMSGCGYWLLVFGGPDDPVPFEARLEGIAFAQLDREPDGRQCLRANSRAAIHHLLREGHSAQAQAQGPN